MKFKILFVCTGNTCRSNMAEYLAKQLLADNRYSVDSAGLMALDGSPAAPQAIEVMAEKGIDMGEHRAQKLSAELIREADLILTMTYRHQEAILEIYPDTKAKLFTLQEFADKIESDGELKKNVEELNISDPFGQSLAIYRQCAEEIERHIKSTVQRLKEDAHNLGK